MASIQQYYSNYHQLSTDELSEITSMMAQANYGGTFSSTTIPSSDAIVSDNNVFPVLVDNGGLDIYTPESNVSLLGPLSSFPEQLGISNMPVDYKLGLSGIAKIQNFGSGLQITDVCEFGDEYCCGPAPSFKPLCSPDSGENWGIQCNQIPTIHDHNNIKVGRYTMEERKDRIHRYLKKRNQRNFNKTIKYACRKTLADRRIRIRGRFARNNELCEEETRIKKNENPHQERDSYCNDTTLQVKNDDDEWLQEAMASLMCAPYIAGDLSVMDN